MDISALPMISALWFGILTSISPCPLATNIAATTFIGKQIETRYGTLHIPQSQIREIREIGQFSLKKGEYWFPNPNTTRLFFAPTARTLEKGDGYFADYYLFFPLLHLS